MNVQDLLDELRVQYRGHGESPHVTQGWIGVECPWCGAGSGKYGLGVHLRDGRVNCWKCGPHRLVELVATLGDVPFKRAKELVGGLDRVLLPEYEVRGTLELPAAVGPLLPAHKRYLRGRGFDPDALVRLWGIQGIGLAVDLPWRIFIPITLAGRVVSWTTRLISDDVPVTERYRGAKREQEGVPRKNVLYGEDYCRHAIVVHEGPTDVWATGPGAVCTCGTGFSRAQIARIAKYPVRVIAFDSEPTAQQRARALARDVESFPGETYVVQMSGKDAASSPEEDRRELRQMFLE